MDKPRRTFRSHNLILHFNRQQLKALSDLATQFRPDHPRPSKEQFESALESLGPAPTMRDLAGLHIKNARRGTWSHEITPSDSFRASDIPSGCGLKRISRSRDNFVMVNPAREWWRSAYENWPSNRQSATISHKPNQKVDLSATIPDRNKSTMPSPSNHRGNFKR